MKTEQKGKQDTGPKIRFRSHISSIVERTGGVIAALFIIAATQVFQNIGEIRSEDISFVMDRGFFILSGVILILGICIASQVFVWAKTWISIEDQAVVIEKNTLNKKKNTIGIRNISNINIEQNLFEMLIGTCKVKVDTNSRSTADSTDVKIVLKKADALRFKNEITRRMRLAAGGAAAGVDMDPELDRPETAALAANGAGREGRAADPVLEEPEDYDIRADLGDIMKHGFFSVNLFSVAIFLLCILGTVMGVAEALRQRSLMESFAGAAAGIILAAVLILSALWDTIKDFVKYYDFRAKRRGDRIYIRYGFLKKVEYTVPVDKIQALRVRQSFVARLGKRYMAEIINVGMGDDAEEKHSFLVLYGTEKQLKERLSLLLPEFLPAADLKVERLPKAVWVVWIFPAVVCLLCVAAGAVLCAAVLENYQSAVWGSAAALALALLGGMVLKYRTDGMSADGTFLKLCRGYFGKHYLAVKYRNIQYVEFSQSFLAAAFHLKKGRIHLLASSADTSHGIPYFRGDADDVIKNGITGSW